MSERQGRDLDPKKLSERQVQIVAAALRIIATKGSRRFTADVLAREVGLTGGALYRHFASMDDVVDAVVDRVGAVLFEGFPPEADDPIERLRLFFYRRARTILANPHISRLLLSEHLAQAGGVVQSKRLGEFKKKSQAFVSESLTEAREHGLLADGMSPQAGTIVVLGSVLALSHAAPRLVDARESDHLCNEVWLGIERMLRCPESVAKPMARAARSPRRNAKK
jgi:AcrR family transcriptional regulator